ncbi:hypothetical protein, partial [Aeromonas veronii]|uniref:hypothetical protein n=1 Tax=Aeromonas veronii TaxID=654 RepID=UPI003D217511
MVVIRSPRPQLVPFRLHRFGKQRRDELNLLKPANGGELRARTSLTRFMPQEKIRPDSQFCRALLAIGLTSP